MVGSEIVVEFMPEITGRGRKRRNRRNRRNKE